ncbi:hypothetical protein DSM00_1070 [Leeuwenhoekiella aequorea]|uniref:Uncharacterized protein n=1 Tax=Leeuwenhoekiella aequorea TaxID=283736 RepID=A0A4Q0PAW2_9FLAO|nr:hypothetical protein DSM00_1070 [Leeuwenhoekiella aequorea]
MNDTSHKHFMRKAIQWAQKGQEIDGGGAFGAGCGKRWRSNC